MRKSIVLAGCCAALLWLAAGTGPARGQPCPDGVVALNALEIVPTGAAKDGEQYRLVVHCPKEPVTVAVPPTLQSAIEWYSAYKQKNMSDDVAARIGTGRQDGAYVLREIVLQAPFSRGWAVLILAGAGVALLLLVNAATRGRPTVFLIGVDDLYSNSQCQMAFWFATTLVVYLTVLVVRYCASGGVCWAGITIPENLLTLSGISAFTFAAAKGISTRQQQDAAAPSCPAPMKKPAQSLQNLATNACGDFDLGDFQMIVVTGLVIAVYLGTVVRSLGQVSLESLYAMPDVDGALLSAFGLGQGAYLLKKLATPLGRG